MLPESVTKCGHALEKPGCFHSLGGLNLSVLHSNGHFHILVTAVDEFWLVTHFL
jgi:hypothetical protein